MPFHAERIEFNPPPQKGSLRSFGLALLAHGFLIAALTWGVSWKRTAESSAVEAELWSTTVMQAAPRAVETPPPPPVPQPTARVRETPPPPAVRQADIAIERERKQKEEDRKEREEQRELEKKRLAEKDARDKKAAAEKLALDKRKQEEARKREELQDRQEQVAADKRRQDNLRRMQSMAGASGGPEATGNAMQSSGPSAGYAGRLSALFKRNISFPNPEAINGNPKAIVEVRVSPAGLIMSSRLTKSSGVPAWDDAVLRAVEKTERIPGDNGRFVSVFPVEFGPKD